MASFLSLSFGVADRHQVRGMGKRKISGIVGRGKRRGRNENSPPDSRPKVLQLCLLELLALIYQLQLSQLKSDWVVVSGKVYCCNAETTDCRVFQLDLAAFHCWYRLNVPPQRYIQEPAKNMF